MSVDAALVWDETRCGVRGIFHNYIGRILLAYSVPHAQPLSTLMAEAMMGLHGLEKPFADGFTNVMV